MVTRKPVSHRNLELLAMPTIASQMPVVFANGNVWMDIKCECLECKATLPSGWVTGIVSRPIPGVAVIEATGVCNDCRLVTTFDYRLHDDMRVTGPREDGWHTWKVRPTLWDRIRALFSSRRA